MRVGLRTREKDSEKKSTRYYSKRQEKSVANDLKGIVTKNSGATPFQKSDVLLDNFSIECKTKMTNSESISIKKEWLEKLISESLFMGKKYSALVFNFGPDSKNYVILEENTFKDLIDNLENKA